MHKAVIDRTYVLGHSEEGGSLLASCHGVRGRVVGHFRIVHRLVAGSDLRLKIDEAARPRPSDRGMDVGVEKNFNVIRSPVSSELDRVCVSSCGVTHRVE